MNEKVPQEAERESALRMSSPSKVAENVAALRMHVARATMVTPRSSLLRKSVRVDRGDVGSSEQYQTLGEPCNSRQLGKVTSEFGRCTSRGIRRARMQNVVCCNHARMRSSAGKSTQSRSSQGAAEIANASCVHSSGSRRM